MKRTFVSLIVLGSAFALSVAGCGGDDTGAPPECLAPSSANTKQFVINALTVPMQRPDFAFDLNGDGKLDNQLGNIIGALTQNNLDTQGGVNNSIMAGSSLLLLDESSADATAQSDTCAGSNLYVAQKMPMPDFTGAGKFTIDTASGKGSFGGRISGGKFTSNSPVTTSHPVSVQLAFPFVANTDPVILKVIGARIQFTRSANGIMAGQINGAIKNSDVHGSIIPSVANLLTSRIAADPNSSGTKQIESIFDTGGTPGGTCAANNPPACTNADGTCGVKGDGKIQICEVETSSIIMNVLSPDVQMFDAAGNYHPTAANTMKDSLSLGMGFTAVPATFQ